MIFLIEIKIFRNSKVVSTHEEIDGFLHITFWIYRIITKSPKSIIEIAL